MSSDPLAVEQWVKCLLLIIHSRSRIFWQSATVRSTVGMKARERSVINDLQQTRAEIAWITASFSSYSMRASLKIDCDSTRSIPPIYRSGLLFPLFSSVQKLAEYNFKVQKWKLLFIFTFYPKIFCLWSLTISRLKIEWISRLPANDFAAWTLPLAIEFSIAFGLRSWVLTLFYHVCTEWCT